MEEESKVSDGEEEDKGPNRDLEFRLCQQIENLLPIRYREFYAKAFERSEKQILLKFGLDRLQFVSEKNSSVNEKCMTKLYMRFDALCYTKRDPNPILVRFTVAPEADFQKCLIFLMKSFQIDKTVLISITKTNKDEIVEEIWKNLLYNFDGSRNPLSSTTTIIRRYFPHNFVNQYLPMIHSPNILLNCAPEIPFQRFNYLQMANNNINKKLIHFGKEIEQSFKTRDDFQVLVACVLKHPTIECFSFTCLFENFNFKYLFEILEDLKFEIPNRIINLAFNFQSIQYKSLLQYRIWNYNEQKNLIINFRNSKSDCIYVTFSPLAKKFPKKRPKQGKVKKEESPRRRRESTDNEYNKKYWFDTLHPYIL